MGEQARRWHQPDWADLPAKAQLHLHFATDQLQHAAREISAVMRKHQLKLADRQCRMAELSSRVQMSVVMLATALYAQRQPNELVRTAADCLCQEFTFRLSGRRPTDRYYRQITELGAAIADGQFPELVPAVTEPIMMRYPQPS